MLRMAFHGIEALKGHDFSRAANAVKKTRTLAPEGCFSLRLSGNTSFSTSCFTAEGTLAIPKIFPQGLKPGVHFGALAARLKSCPFKAKRISLDNILCCFTILLIASASIAAQTKPKPAVGYSIAGTVVNAASGEPVRRATVSVQDEESRQIIASVETDSEGRFSLDGLSAAKYPLTASKRGFLTGYYDEHESFNSAIVTGADQQTSGLIFRLTPGASLHGVVTGDGGDPVEGASVMLFLKPHHHNPGDRIRKVEDATTDDTGAYEFDGLAAGDYLVAVKAEPWFAILQPSNEIPQRLEGPVSALDVAYPVAFFDSTYDEAAATSIILTGGDSEEANINLHSVPALHLLFNPAGIADGYQGGERLYQTVFGTRIPVNKLTMFGNSQPFIVDCGGLAPGHYEAVQGTPSRILELNASTSQRIDTTFGKPTIAVTGIVQTAPGVTLQGKTKLVLNSLDDTNHQEPISTEYGTGEIEFLDVPQGIWELWVERNGSVLPVTSLTIGGQKHPGNQLIVRDKPLQVTATASLSETRVEGFARNKEGKGQSGVMIVLVPKEMAAFRSLARRDQSDSDGSFSLRDVAPGQYTVVAIEDGWELDWQRPEVIRRYLSGGIPVTVTEDSGKLLRLTGPVPVQRP
jgi:5-hydroxyisourate hydrolase-like protein (transthyretin family)